MSAVGEPTSVTVVIPVFNSTKDLEVCLAFLAQQDFPEDNLEILVVDNSRDGDLASINLGRNIRLLHEPRKGSYAARNTGIRQARGDVIAFTDADCRPSPHWITEGVKALIAGADRVAGSIVLSPRNDPPNVIERFEAAATFDAKRALDTRGHVATANMFVWKSLFTQVGYFREDMYSGGDFEWSKRFNRLQLRTSFAPDAIVNHPTRGSFIALVKHRKRLAGAVQASRGFRERIAWVKETTLSKRGLLPGLRHQPTLRASDQLAFLIIASTIHVVMFLYTLRYALIPGEPPRS